MDIIIRWIVLSGAVVTFGIGAAIIDHLPVGDIRWDRKKEFLLVPFIIATTCLVVYWSYQSAKLLFRDPVMAVLRFLKSIALLSGVLILYILLMYYDFMLFTSILLPFGLFIAFWLAEDVYSYISRSSSSRKLS